MEMYALYISFNTKPDQIHARRRIDDKIYCVLGL